jgi:Predicted ATPase
MFSDLYIDGVKIRKDVGESGSYVLDLPVVKSLLKKRELPFRKNVTFFAGENGTGKSTLLEAIAVSFGFNAEGGTRNFNFATEETHSDLCRYLTTIKGIKRPKDGFFLRAESFYNVASEIDRLDLQPYYGGRSLHQQSHGESFMSLILNRFGGNGVYILDEPEAALSPSRQMTLMSAIDYLVKENSQFIIATHSPILMAYPNADIFVLTDGDILLTPYEETEHFTLTKQFLNNHQKMLRYLLDEK